MMEPVQEEKSLEKWVPVLDSPAALNDALDKAVDYRGDVTLTLKDGTQLTGYVFSRNSRAAEPYVDLLPADQDQKRKVPVKEIAGLSFSGVDMAAGRSWAAWVARHQRG